MGTSKTWKAVCSVIISGKRYEDDKLKRNPARTKEATFSLGAEEKVHMSGEFLKLQLLRVFFGSKTITLARKI